MQQRGLVQDEKQEKPTHFDLQPFLNALKKFCIVGPETRMQVRNMIK